MHVKYFLLTLNIFAQALSGLERMQELVGKNLNNIVGNLWQRQENEGSGSSHGNIVSTTDTVQTQYSTVQNRTEQYSTDTICNVVSDVR